ncbi:MAG TPA: thiamine ABC transporter substrate-binding protein [Acidimicrobiia bacterium]|nr:thiamine ABC transporter substrate-binding protein [Acidimicrobiia bacterium]
MKRSTAALAVLVTVAALLASCGSSGGTKPAASKQTTTITLMTHDDFATSKSLLPSFTRQTGITVKVLHAGDAGAAVNQAILTKSHPLGDAFFGVDNTFLSRALDAGIFVPYASPELSQVPAEFRLDPQHRVTPIDYGDVCVNDDKGYFADHHLAVPQTLDDLADARYKNLLVVENPADSSPGLAFVLATVARYGPDHWLDYWKRLKDNGVKVVSSWTDAYDGSFSGSGAGRKAGGDRPLVVSYASSPPAEVIGASPQPATSPIGTLLGTCFRQVEFAGVLRGTHKQAAAEKLIDFMLSARFQEDVPLNMFVFPVRTGTPLPAVFTKFAQLAPDPYRLPPAEIGRNRDAWIKAWTDTVLR